MDLFQILRKMINVFLFIKEATNLQTKSSSKNGLAATILM